MRRKSMRADIVPLAGAGLSDCGHYRYWLARTWNPGAGILCWIMLNPSTADANVDDPTIRRCIGFARTWEYGGIEVVNLFGYRATNPADLERCPVDVVGRDNRHHIRAMSNRCPIVIAAWGAHPQATPLVVRMTLAALVGQTQLYVLGLTKAGAPRHPLYVRGDAEPIRWAEPDGNDGPRPRSTAP